MAQTTQIPGTSMAVLTTDRLNTELQNITNATIPPELPLSYAIAEQVIISTTIVTILLGMGCVTDHVELVENLRRPWGVAAAFITQFLLMPIVGACFIFALNLSYGYSIGTIIMASCPGGALSNVFSYWSASDVSLSICLTTCSSIFAMVALPLLLLIFSEGFTSDQPIQVPFENIAITLILIIVPGIVGILTRYKYQRVADVIARICSVLGCCGLISFIALKAATAPEMFLSPYEPYLVSISLPPIGFSIGFSIATIFRMIPFKRRAVAIETGYQNVGLALAIITLSYQDDSALIELQTVPVFYAIFGTSMALLSIGAYRLYLLWQRRREDAEDKDSLLEEDDKYDGNGVKNFSYGSIRTENDNILVKEDKKETL